MTPTATTSACTRARPTPTPRPGTRAAPCGSGREVIHNPFKRRVLEPHGWQPRRVDPRGVYSLQQLLAAGVSRAQLKQELSVGRLRRIGRGWFAEPFADSEVVRAITLGGRLGCLSGSRAHGLWVPPDSHLHVVVNPGVAVPRSQSGVQFHRLDSFCADALASVDQCLGQVIQRHSPEEALVVLESAVNLELVAPADARALINAAPVRKRRALEHFQLGAQSGSETRLRLFFQQRRVKVKSQAFIPGVGRVDMLVGRSWIVEADSHAHHSAGFNIEVDRDRDLNAWELGYERTRFTYQQIWWSWERTQQALLAGLASKRHLRPPKPRAA